MVMGIEHKCDGPSPPDSFGEMGEEIGASVWNVALLPYEWSTTNEKWRDCVSLYKQECYTVPPWGPVSIK